MQKERRSACIQESPEELAPPPTEKMTKNRQYTQLWLNAIVILDVTTFPLFRDRWGIIPIPAQHFFKSYIDEYLKNETLTNRREIKENDMGYFETWSTQSTRYK